MKKTLLLKYAILLLTTSLMSSCIWWVGDEGHYRGGEHERGRGEFHGDHHEEHGDHR